MDELLKYIEMLQESNDRFKERHNPKCECEWAQAVDSTLSLIRNFINTELK